MKSSESLSLPSKEISSIVQRQRSSENPVQDPGLSPNDTDVRSKPHLAEISSKSLPGFSSLVVKKDSHGDAVESTSGTEERALFSDDSSDSDFDGRTSSESIKVDTKANFEIGFNLNSTPDDFLSNSVSVVNNSKVEECSENDVSPRVSPRSNRSLAVSFPESSIMPKLETKAKYSIIWIPFVQIMRMEKLTQMFQKVTGAQQIVQIDCKDFR